MYIYVRHYGFNSFGVNSARNLAIVGKINDQKWDIPNRNQRVIPLIIVVIYGFLILAFRQDFPIKFYLVNVVFLLIITRFWKISIHCYGLSAIIIALIKSNNVLNGNPLYFIVPIYFLFLIATIWSRLYLKKHTLLQVVLGTFFGFLINLWFV
ncbi:MAG: hypothetical protein PWP15_688 [Methanothermococcus sp.]|nr:hypothetical protein [Methanothermococcus sp.]